MITLIREALLTAQLLSAMITDLELSNPSHLFLFLQVTLYLNLSAHMSKFHAAVGLRLHARDI